MHLRIFFDQRVPVKSLLIAMQMVGLKHAPGKIEIFPSQTQGMRLPFGFIPGRKHNPSSWVGFIRKYRRKQWPIVNWVQFKSQAKLQGRLRRRRRTSSQTVPHGLEPHKRQRQVTRKDATPSAIRETTSEVEEQNKRFLDLVSNEIKSVDEAQELWRLGIRLPGTRTICTQCLAWHLIYVKRLTVAEAIAELVDWVYRTGAITSRDVQEDLRTAQRKVETQIKKCVEWMATHPTRSPKVLQSRSHVGIDELATVMQLTEPFAEANSALLPAALRLLRYAKLHGEIVNNFWEVILSINGVVRKWPECRGSNKYKAVMDVLQSCGLITMTKDKAQSQNKTGRPRTYRVFQGVLNRALNEVHQLDFPKLSFLVTPHATVFSAFPTHEFITKVTEVKNEWYSIMNMLRKCYLDLPKIDTCLRDLRICDFIEGP